jgi:hypothetical protein
MKYKYINLTGHPINMNDGRVFPAHTDADGKPVKAIVSEVYSEIVDDVSTTTMGPVTNLPDPVEGVRYIVSGIVLGAVKGTRPDVVAPATMHKDAVRNEQKHVISVPCFVQ